MTIEEHSRELLALNRNFGVTLLDAVTLLQESDAFLESVKVVIIMLMIFNDNVNDLMMQLPCIKNFNYYYYCYYYYSCSDDYRDARTLIG